LLFLKLRALLCGKERTNLTIEKAHRKESILKKEKKKIIYLYKKIKHLSLTFSICEKEECHCENKRKSEKRLYRNNSKEALNLLGAICGKLSRRIPDHLLLSKHFLKMSD
jgi:hypothetical protein